MMSQARTFAPDRQVSEYIASTQQMMRRRKRVSVVESRVDNSSNINEILGREYKYITMYCTHVTGKKGSRHKNSPSTGDSVESNFSEVRTRESN